MKLLIAVPSKNRVEILKQNALKWLPTCGYDWAVFVEPQDFEAYKDIVPKNILTLAENSRGLGYAKAFIKQYAKANGYTHIFKVDDDVRGFTKWRQNLSDEAHSLWFREFMQEITNSLQLHPVVKAVCFPYRFEMYEKRKWHLAKRIQTAYIVETESLYVDPAISVFEDFATGLKIVVDGNAIMRYGLAGIKMGVKVGGGTGGHQSFDRYEQAMKEIEPLRKLYPALSFRKVDKPWKIEPDMTSVLLPPHSL